MGMRWWWHEWRCLVSIVAVHLVRLDAAAATPDGDMAASKLMGLHRPCPARHVSASSIQSRLMTFSKWANRLHAGLVLLAHMGSSWTHSVMKEPRRTDYSSFRYSLLIYILASSG